MIKAIIFDYDGLLVDTEDLWFQSCRKLCGEYGVELTEQNREELMRSGLSAYLVQRFSLPDSVEVIKAKLNGIFNDLTKNGVRPLPGAIELVRNLSKKYPLAIASGSHRETILATLRSLEILDCFKVVVGIKEVVNGKPAPDLFLKAAEELKVNPKDILVFEDQPKGLAGARAASMHCIVIPNKYLQNMDYSRADMVVESLELITDELIQELGKERVH
jgi:HAD superfamily hydrolase (TIGR01509 family)